MGKASMCIRMLQLLNSGRVYKISELADLLETNSRNIIEYKRELEECGYYIISIPGRYGGYKIDKSTIIPSLVLTDDEKKVLSSSVGYIESKDEFLQKKEFEKVISKIMSAINNPEIVEQPYIIPGVTRSMSNEDLFDRYNAIDLCIKQKRKIIIHFLSIDNVVRERKIEPYKLFMYNNSWFVIGFCNLVHDYRYFKLNRIEKYEITKEKFIVPKYFDEKEYFDKNGFKKGTDWANDHNAINEWIHIKLLLHNRPALYVKEYIYGKNQNIIAIDKDNTILECDMCYKYNVIKFALSFGNDCDVLEPLWLKDEIISIAEKIISKK